MKNLIVLSFAVLLAGILTVGCQENGGESGAETQDTGAQVHQTSSEVQTGTEQPVVAERPQGGSRNTVPFKGSKAGIAEQMSKVPGVEMRMDTTGKYGEGLAYSGGRFAGFPVVDWSFRFLDGQMVFAQINYNDQTAGAPGDSIFAAVAADMEEWFGKPVLNSEIQVTSLNNFTEPEQLFISKVGSSLYGDFKLWSVGEDTQYVAYVNKVQWNQSENVFFVHVAFLDRAQSEAFFQKNGAGEAAGQ